MVSNSELKKQIAELFQKTGSDHHQAFIETDGEDPEWPLWYAECLVINWDRSSIPNLQKMNLFI